MRYKTAIVTLSRTTILTLALLLSIGFGAAAAQGSHGPALTECDQSGCALGYPKATADFLDVDDETFDRTNPYVSHGPLNMGFTR